MKQPQKVTISVPLEYPTATAIMLQAMKLETTIEEIIERLAVDYVHEIGFDHHVEPIDLVKEAVILPFEGDEYIADENAFTDLKLSVRAKNLLRKHFRSIDDVLSLKDDPCSIDRLGDASARQIAYALYKAGHNIEDTVWNKYFNKKFSDFEL